MAGFIEIGEARLRRGVPAGGGAEKELGRAAMVGRNRLVKPPPEPLSHGACVVVRDPKCRNHRN